MRWLPSLIFVLALGLMGCSETSGTGGSGGSAGGGGTGGDGGSAGSGGTGGIGGHGGTGGTAGFGGEGGNGGAGGIAGNGGTGGTAPLCHDNLCRCTREGVHAAISEGGGPYTFTCDGPTVVTGGGFSLDTDVVLDGEGNLILDGDETYPVFHVQHGVTVELHNLTVTRGATQGNGGAIWNEGALTITNSTIADNTALCEGSCLYQGFGGGIYNDNFATLTMVNSTVSNNIAREWGGGIFNFGAVTVTNSTVSGNTAKNGSGICGFNATLTNSTVSGNTSTNGSDICNGSVTLTHSLIDGDCEGILPPASNGYNLESPGSTCGFDQIGDRSGITAEQLNLGPLADNGGPTLTHKPGDGDFDTGGSAAIDQIPEADCEVTEDQRGEPRPVAILGPEPKCDVGSIEVQ